MAIARRFVLAIALRAKKMEPVLEMRSPNSLTQIDVVFIKYLRTANSLFTVAVTLQPRRSDVGIHLGKSGLHADHLELETGAHHAALQGVLTGRHSSLILTRLTWHPH